MIRLIVMTAIYLVVMGGLLFGSAGRLDLPMGWVYMVILTATTVAILVFGDSGMLLVLAGKEKGVKKWDTFIASVSFLLFCPVSYLEDRTLHKELDEYSQYASRVRWRLVPGIW